MTICTFRVAKSSAFAVQFRALNSLYFQPVVNFFQAVAIYLVLNEIAVQICEKRVEI